MNAVFLRHVALGTQKKCAALPVVLGDGDVGFEVAAQSGAGNRRSLSRSDAPVAGVSGRDARGEASPSEALTEEEEKALLKKRREAEKARLKAYKERLERPINGYVFEPDSLLAQPDSMSLLRFTRGVHFADSLKYGLSDSIQAQWAGWITGKRWYTITEIHLILMAIRFISGADRGSFGISDWG